MRRRRGQALRVDIVGRDHLVSEHGDVMLEAATTSFQIHLKARRLSPTSITTPPSRFLALILPPAATRRFYSASAMGGNQHSFFEQALDVPGANST